LHSNAYREIGITVSFWQAFRIFHLSRIGNYLPGRVWFATNYYLFSKKMNIDTEKIAKNFVVLNVLAFITGSICSLPIIYYLSPSVQKLLIVFPLLMIILIHPKVFSKIFSAFWENKTGKDFRYIFLFKVSVLYLIGYIILGVGLYLCVSAFKTVDFFDLPLMVGTAASFVLTILLAFFAPAGIGVSEGISAVILSQIIPFEIAVMAVLALRVVMVLVDFSCALISAMSVAREEKPVVMQVDKTVQLTGNKL
jgi:hypothetical protein